MQNLSSDSVGSLSCNFENMYNVNYVPVLEHTVQSAVAEQGDSQKLVRLFSCFKDTGFIPFNHGRRVRNFVLFEISKCT